MAAPTQVKTRGSSMRAADVAAQSSMWDSSRAAARQTISPRASRLGSGAWRRRHRRPPSGAGVMSSRFATLMGLHWGKEAKHEGQAGCSWLTVSDALAGQNRQPAWLSRMPVVCTQQRRSSNPTSAPSTHRGRWPRICASHMQDPRGWRRSVLSSAQVDTRQPSNCRRASRLACDALSCCRPAPVMAVWDRLHSKEGQEIQNISKQVRSCTQGSSRCDARPLLHSCPAARGA